MKAHIKNYLKSTGLLPHEITCENCGSNHAVNIHHIVFRSHGGSDNYDNLIALCQDVCHRKAHSDKRFNESLKEIARNR